MAGVELRITDLNHDGDGVGRDADGRVVFVPGALPGERVSAQIVETGKRFARAELAARLDDSPERVEPPCPVAGECGGCRLQHMAYPAQLAWKRARVEAALARIGRIEGARVHPVLGMENPFHYRNKAQYPLRAGEGGGVEIGFFRRGTHDVVPHDDCLIQHPAIPRVAHACRALIEEMEIPVYDETAHTGVVRHIAVRASFATGEVMVIAVTRTHELPHERAFVEALRLACPDVVSVAQNVNPERTNAVYGRTTRILWGKAQIVERLGELEFEISPTSFFQVNPAQAERAYDAAKAYAAVDGEGTVWDVYCGAGAVGLYVAGRDARLRGVDVVAEAVRDARRNAARNGIARATFVAGRAEEVLPEWVAAGERPDVCLLDPPRSGCDRATLEAVLRAGPERVVYISCNPQTFARDAAILCEGRRYRLTDVQPVDMFPQTPHIETVGLFLR